MGLSKVLALQQATDALPDPASLAFGLRPWLALVLVLALLAATVWVLRATAATRRSRQALAVESALSLGEKRSLVIVSVEGRRLLVGVAPGGVSLVTELHAPFTEALAQSMQAGEQA
jgi:flagellar protein FliO/FliZ